MQDFIVILFICMFIFAFIMLFYSVLKVIYFSCKKHKQIEELEQLEVIKYIDDSIPVDPSIECSICLSNKTDIKLPCSHCYHVECLEEWFDSSPTCPLCRKNYEEYLIENV